MICRNTFSENRVATFLAGSNRILTGGRRSGVAALLDAVESEIARLDANASVIRVRSEDSFPERIESEYLIIDNVLGFPEWEYAVAETATNPVEVIYGLELCHQVPVCARAEIRPNP